MSVIPFVCFSVSVCILLNVIKLSRHYFSEFLDLHADRRQLGDVKCRRLVLLVGKAMRAIIHCVFQA